MHCLDYVERPQPYNLLSFMLHEVVFFRYHSKFASGPGSHLLERVKGGDGV